jgi:transcriptional regulator with XRE-family HTH domain
VGSTVGAHAVRFGKYIRDRREELKLTQEDIAAQLGVSQPLVSRWEQGKDSPVDRIDHLARILEVPLIQLVERVFELFNPVEQAIMNDDALLPKERTAMLSAYGALTGRDSARLVASFQAQVESERLRRTS